jgi:DNA-binding response OmpR family regulator
MGQTLQAVHRILVTDREFRFSSLVCGALTDEGYACVCPPDVMAYVESLRRDDCELAIVDVATLAEAQRLGLRKHDSFASSVPIILVTGGPGSDEPVNLVQLRVISVVERSIPPSRLVDCVKLALSQLAAASIGMPPTDDASASPLSLGALLDLTRQEIGESLSNLNRLTNAALAGNRVAFDEDVVCHLFRCPRLATLSASIADAIEVLEKAKSSFKSRELGELRKKLEKLLRETAMGRTE